MTGRLVVLLSVWLLDWPSERLAVPGYVELHPHYLPYIVSVCGVCSHACMPVLLGLKGDFGPPVFLPQSDIMTSHKEWYRFPRSWAVGFIVSVNCLFVKEQMEICVVHKDKIHSTVFVTPMSRRPPLWTTVAQREFAKLVCKTSGSKNTVDSMESFQRTDI